MALMYTDMDKFREALRAVGGQTALGRRLTEVTGQTVTQKRISMWIHRRHVPAQWVPYVSIVSGVPASAINPSFALIEKRIA